MSFTASGWMDGYLLGGPQPVCCTTMRISEPFSKQIGGKDSKRPLSVYPTLPRSSGDLLSVWPRAGQDIFSDRWRKAAGRDESGCGRIRGVFLKLSYYGKLRN